MVLRTISNPPVMSDPANFASTMSAFVASLNNFATDLNALNTGTTISAANGATLAAASGTAYTAFALPGISISGPGKFTLVRANVLDIVTATNNPLGTNYIAFALIGHDGTYGRIVYQINGTNLTITLASGNVQMTQSHAAGQLIVWSYFSF